MEPLAEVNRGGGGAQRGTRGSKFFRLFELMDYNVRTLRQSLNIEREAISLQAKSSATTAFICFEHIVLANGSATSKCVTATWGRSEFVPSGTILVRDGVGEWEGSIVESEDDVVPYLVPRPSCMNSLINLKLCICDECVAKSCVNCGAFNQCKKIVGVLIGFGSFQ